MSFGGFTFGISSFGGFPAEPETPATPPVSAPLSPNVPTVLDRLLDYLPGVYDATPDPLLGLRLSYDTGQMQWRITDDTLMTMVAPGGPGVPLLIDLAQYTLSTLTQYLAAQPGYTVPYLDATGYDVVSALALVPGTGDIATSNGDHLYVAQNPTWIHLAAIAADLELAAQAIVLMPLEMQTTTADGSWLDLLGSYYAVPRQLGEQDAQYSPRIPAEVILPRQNNTAIAAALEATTGQIATCTDVRAFGNPTPAFDGQISFSGAPHFYNAHAAQILNLFDVSIGYDLLGSLSPTDFMVLIQRQIDRLRAAGTHLRTLTLTPSVMGDRFAAPSDSLTEILSIQSISGTGESFDSAIAVGFFPTDLVPLAFSSNSAVGDLSTGIVLAGTGVSVDAIALPLPAATGSSANSAVADLSTFTPLVLAGTGGQINSTFGYLGLPVIFNGVSASSNSGIATLRTGPGLVGTGSSANSGVLFRYVGSGTSANSAAGTLSTTIRLVGSASSGDSAAAPLTTVIRMFGSGTSADTGSGTAS